jgi:hypothetical protein
MTILRTLLCCKQINNDVYCFVNANVNGKSATSMSRRMYAEANPVRRFSPVDDVNYDSRYFSTENVRSAVAVDTGRVAKMNMQQRVNCRRMFLSHIRRALIQTYAGLSIAWQSICHV